MYSILHRIMDLTEKGILKPTINEENDYRDFRHKDASDLYQSRKYNKIGFSLDEIKKLMSTESLEELEGFYEKRRNELEEQIYSSLFLGSYLEKQLKLINKIQNRDFAIDLVDSPDFYRISIYNALDQSRGEKSLKRSKGGASLLPFTSGSMLFSINDYSREKEIINIDIGYIYYSDELQALQIDPKALQHFPTKKCVYGIVYGPGKELGLRSRFDNFINEVSINDYPIEGTIYTREIVYIRDQGETYRYDEVWAPLIV